MRLAPILTASAIVLAGLAAALAQPGAPATEPARPAPRTPAPDAPKPPVPFRPDLSHLAFLEGAWSVADDQGYSEEIWSAPRGDNLVGCFRLCRPDGAAAMFELLAITREEAGVMLRLRHHTPALAAREEKDRPLTMRLSTVEGRRAVFVPHADAGDVESLTYDGSADGTLGITLVFAPAKKRSPLVFAMKRSGR